MSLNKIFNSCLLMFCIVLMACNTSKKEALNNVQEAIVFPDFKADSAYLYIAKQVSFGPRIPGSKSQLETAKYLAGFMQQYADTVIVQDFSAKNWEGRLLKGKNIISVFGKDKPQRILLAAHWDSRPVADHDPDPKNRNKPIHGANDGASGVAVLMELARIMQQQAPKKGIDIIFFDLEDVGTPEGMTSEVEDTWCLGSQYWAQNPHTRFYKAQYGILLDMVGGRNPHFTKEATSMYYASDVMNRVWDIAYAMGYANIFVNETTGGMIDDHLYVNKITGIPMIDIIHYDPHTSSRFVPQWHTLEDNLEHIEKSTLQIVGDVVVRVIYEN